MRWHQLLDCCEKERAGHHAAQCVMENCGCELRDLGGKKSPYCLCSSWSTKWTLLSVGPLCCHSKIIAFRQELSTELNSVSNCAHGKKMQLKTLQELRTWLWLLAGVTTWSGNHLVPTEGENLLWWVVTSLNSKGLRWRSANMRKCIYIPFLSTLLSKLKRNQIPAEVCKDK